MRIAYIGDPKNIHTRRWVEFFSNRQHAVALFCDPPVNQPIQDVEIICPRMSLLRKAIAFKLFRHPFSNNYFKAAPYSAAVAHWTPDIVHGMEALANGYATAACRRPTVLSPWGNDIFDWPRKSKFAHYLTSKALRGATCISTNAPGLETFLERAYGIERDKVDCFSWGVDLKTFFGGQMEEADSFGRRHGLADDARVILSPRAMKPYWGVGLIAEALGEIVRRIGPKAVVVFLRGFGDPRYEAELQGSIEARGLAAHAVFVSETLEPSDMAAAFNRADVFLSLPETDLLSTTVLEGMACGCAPILADLPYYRSRVEHGKNGFYLAERTPDAIARAIEEAYSSPKRLAAMARENERLIALEDDAAKCGARMEALYEELCMRRRR